MKKVDKESYEERKAELIEEGTWYGNERNLLRLLFGN